MNKDAVNLMRAEILIVDDIPANLNILRQALEPEGYEIIAAASGEVALKIAARTQPDVILLDIIMPKMDGFETCRRLKADPSTADIPVIFIEGALIRSGGSEIQPKHLHFLPTMTFLKDESSLEIPINLQQAEVFLIKRALTQAGGNISETARLLGSQELSSDERISQEFRCVCGIRISQRFLLTPPLIFATISLHYSMQRKAGYAKKERLLGRAFQTDLC